MGIAGLLVHQAPNQPVLTTQLYFPREPANRRDWIFHPGLPTRIVNGPELSGGSTQFSTCRKGIGDLTIDESIAPCDNTSVVLAVEAAFASSMRSEQSIVVDLTSPGGTRSPHGLILFDGVCVLCSRGCRFVSKRDRRGYFRFVPIQLAEGRGLAEQLGIDPDRPDSFAFVANGKGYVRSDAVLRIARELPRWRCTSVFHLIPRSLRDAVYDVVAGHRYRWFGRREACILPSSDRTWPL